jgi:hypothetical protein
MDRTKGVSLAKGPTAIIGMILLAGGILGLVMGSTDFTTAAPDGDVSGGTFLGIEGNGWTWVGVGVAGLILLIGASRHWGAKMLALLVGLAMGAACVAAIVDGSDVLGVFAANTATVAVFAATAGALLVIALLVPRVDRRPIAATTDGRVARRRFRRRDGERPAEQVGAGTTTERRA